MVRSGGCTAGAFGNFDCRFFLELFLAVMPIMALALATVFPPSVLAKPELLVVSL